MKKVLLLSCHGLSIAILFFVFSLEKNSGKKSYQQKKVLMKVSSGLIGEFNYSHGTDELHNPELSQLLQEHDVFTLRSIFKNRYNENGNFKKHLIKTEKKLLTGWFEFDISDKYDIQKFIALLKENPQVSHVFEEKPILLQPDIAPSDTEYTNQWHLNNASNPNFDIDAEAAWDVNSGRNDVIVAVLDGGVDYNHPDLDPGDRSRIIQGIDTGDDDNDPLDNLPYNDPDSYAGHGTYIAGVIGARTDNATQVAGIMWNCSIMPVKMVRSGAVRFPFINDWEWTTTAFPSDVADAIDYAVNNGAHVINLSYSFPSMGWPLNDVIFNVPLLYDALDNAYQNNVVITASMGNSFNENNDTRYPGGFDEQVIAVGATNDNGTRSSFSNTGPNIAISAPGTGIWTTERGGGTDNPSGTSFSAPIVAGVAGLVISQGKDRGFNLTNDDTRHIMELTANGQVGPNLGYDEETGHGIVNAHHALQLLDEPNELYHYTSTGGAYVKNQNLSQWILLDNRWGLAAGTYFDVDQYKITKHITFDVPFCSPPQVWMRERQSESLSYGNPNTGRPFSIISNVTSTGFDLEYVSYYVRYNSAAQTINQWVPAAPASTKVAYTAVGEPDPAANVGPVSGPSLVCSSSSTFSVSNVPSGLTTTWSVSPSYLVATDSGTGTTANIQAASSSSSGEATITFTISGGCQNTTVSKDIWVGPKPVIPLLISQGNITDFSNPENIYIDICVSSGSSTIHLDLFGVQNLQAFTYSSGSQPQVVNTSVYWSFPSTSYSGSLRLEYDVNCGQVIQFVLFNNYCSSYLISPNPANDQLVVERSSQEPSQAFTAKGSETEEEIEFILYNKSGDVVLSKKTRKEKTILNTTSLPNGFYYLHVIDNRGIAVREKILIAH